MNKQLIACLLVASLGSFSWGSAQGARTEPFDLKKSQQELQIMKGILSTTLSFVADDLRGREAGASSQRGDRIYRTFEGNWGGANITAYYLYGQGATFIIPISALSAAFSRGTFAFASTGFGDHPQFEYHFDIGEQMDQANMELEAATAALEAERDGLEAMTAQASGTVQSGGVAPATSAAGRGTGSGRGAGSGSSQAVVTPQPPPRPAPRAAGSPPNQEEMRKKLFQAQEQVKKRREEMEARRQKLLQSLDEVKGYLIEALANHGDSLTTVKANEYINIVITTDEGLPFLSEEGTTSASKQVISVQKSWISDYKAGRLTLDAFKQKVLQYET